MKLFRVGTGSGAFLRTKLIGEMQNDAKSKLSDLSKRAIYSNIIAPPFASDLTDL